MDPDTRPTLCVQHGAYRECKKLFHSQVWHVQSGTLGQTFLCQEATSIMDYAVSNLHIVVVLQAGAIDREVEWYK
jgi:hypothetical protein